MANNTSHTGAPGNPVNEALSKAVRNFSKFDLVRRRFQTMHFGYIEPHAIMEGVSTDVLPLQSSHNLRSNTLTNVLMSDIQMHKEYFCVNYDAILPNHWQKVFVNPTYGDDVLPDVNSCVPFKDLHEALVGSYNRIKAAVGDGDTEVSHVQIYVILRELLFLESVVSSGSLLATLGIRLNPKDIFYGTNILPDSIRNNFVNYIDWLIDQVCLQLSKYDYRFTLLKIDGTDDLQPESQYFIRRSASKSNYTTITFREALCKMRERPYFTLVKQYFDVETGDYEDDVDYSFTHDFGVMYDGVTLREIIHSVGLVPGLYPSEEYFNYSRAVAYQLVCAHYFTNDHVDYVYSAELFEQAEQSIYQFMLGWFSTPRHTFTYNGVNCIYDTFSGKIMSYILSYIKTASSGHHRGYAAAFAFWANLFTFRRSLRYRDYFTGCKPTPLALGDTNVAVNNNLVSIIDTTKAIAGQRFLNQVNRIGRRIADYLAGLIPGARAEKDIHEPTWLARTDHVVKSVDNENTASEQYELESSVTSVLRSSDSRFAFELEVGRYCMVIGVTYYDVPRAYPYSIDKLALAADRFDMFIPQLQFIGDQPIGVLELGHLLSSNPPFGYTLRDMQYKQSFDIAIGGFVDKLPGWCFLAPAFDPTMHISPDTIRSYPTELDSYYLSLTGFSLASYYHFILCITNVVNAKRPMVYAPSIL